MYFYDDSRFLIPLLINFNPSHIEQVVVFGAADVDCQCKRVSNVSLDPASCVIEAITLCSIADRNRLQSKQKK